MRNASSLFMLAAAVLFAYCSSDDGGTTGDDGHVLPDNGGDAWDGMTDLPPDMPADSDRDFPERSDNPDDCIPPHALIILDRTMSMHRETGGTPKWTIALEAIATMMAGYRDTIWFGLELFPRDHADCVTLEQRISGLRAGNPDCENGDVVIEPGPGTETDINTRLASTLLCRSTPIEKAVDVALEWFEANPPDIPERKQVAILITDGKETCDGKAHCPTTTLLGMGIKTFAIGFGEETDKKDLSSVACAGGTATDTENCDDSDPTCVKATSGDPPLFYLAENPESLQAALDDIAALIECGGLI